MTVQLLVVCTANICRSPLAEVLLASEVAQRGLADEVVARSAGIQARAGDAASPMSATIASRWGLDLSAHCSTPLSEDLLATSDLVLTMTQTHRRAIVSHDPDVGPRCFTLRELTRLTDDVETPTQRPMDLTRQLASVTAPADARRGASTSHTDDIADPFGQSIEHYARMGRDLLATIPVLATRLFGPADRAVTRTRP